MRRWGLNIQIQSTKNEMETIITLILLQIIKYKILQYYSMSDKHGLFSDEEK